MGMAELAPPISNLQPLTPEILVPRLGEYLVEKKIIKTSELNLALSRQDELKATNSFAPLGQILLYMGVLDRVQLDQAVTEQIIKLREALQQSNIQLEKRVEERTAELMEALSKLAELSQLKANFVANISHELRTPMTHIKGYLELLIDNALGPVNNEQKQSLEVMRSASARLEQLIEDLILFSASEHGKINLHMVKANVYDICIDQVKRTGEKARKKQIKIHLACPIDLPLIEVDENKINWVVNQLLDNAVKFTPHGGQIFLSVILDNRSIKISVSDTGIGIPNDQIKQIFEPFHQLDGSSTRKFGGTGLGLALALKILEAHGTQLMVHSEVGNGAQFEFFLRICQD
jgi:signal transduction histidine kinase